jgi:Squalene-hopene cyclase C-terminal domain
LQPKYDPLQVFSGSKTPPGLYARQKWRREEGSDTWRRDFDATVKALRAGQLANGSWDNSEIITIHRLFGLHLTVREPNESIGRALGWLLSADNLRQFLVMPHRAPDEMYDDMTNEIDETLFYGLPFINSCFGHFAICAGLFLANCFGMDEERKIIKLYDIVAGEIESNGGHWCSIGCTNNALRAFVTHRRYSRSLAMEMMVDYLAQRQLPSGKWKGKTPFFMTLNALAHLDSEQANIQCQNAAEAVLEEQNKDGSWGRTQKEWSTFLVVHALNRLNTLL